MIYTLLERSLLTDSGRQILRFIGDLEDGIPNFQLGPGWGFKSVGGGVKTLPIGLTYNSVLDGEVSEFGFLNTGKSLFLSGTNIADLVVEKRLGPNLGYDIGRMDLSLTLDIPDDVKRALLLNLEPQFTHGKISRTFRDTPVYNLRINEATVEKVREAYETEIALIADKLNWIDRTRKSAIQNANQAILETLTI
ncbi:MAG: hypothetical protein IIA87_04565 [Nanoarchaeota archaeon]|nr:hypothetical protein [Nanoarchaeota archaeon]